MPFKDKRKKVLKKFEKPLKVLEQMGKDEKFLKDKEEKEKKKKEKMEKEKGKGKEKASKKDEKGKSKEQKIVRRDHHPRRNKKEKNKSYAYYIHKVLKTVHPNQASSTGKKCNLSIKAMAILDCLAIDLYGRLTNEAILLTKKQKKRTLSSIEVQTATRLVLPGELAKHAMGDGTKAVLNYQQREEQ